MNSFRQSRCEHVWTRVGGIDRIGLVERQHCTVLGCTRKRTIRLQRCPRCNMGPIGTPVEPGCWLCKGERVIPVPHTCRCCESRNLAKGAALCLPCFAAHGYAKEYICERKTPAELDQEEALGL